MDRIASALPDFGQPETPTMLGALGAFIGGSVAYGLTGSLEVAERIAFVSGLVGFGAGLIGYLIGPVTGLY